MTEKYFIYRDDGMILSTAYLTPEEAAMQTNITDIEPELEAGKVPWFIDGAWQNRDIVVITEPAWQQRARAYPPIGEQLDMLWHAMDRGEMPKAPGFYDVIKRVKEDHPVESKQVFEVGPMPEA